jgi:hypothetical protein
MKKILPFLTAAVIIVSAGKPVNAQPTQVVPAFQNDAEIAFSSPPATANKRKPGTYPSNINIKAIRDFVRSYRNASGEKWYELSDGFVVHFYMNNNKYRAFYKFNGDWLHTLSAYGGDQLPSLIRHKVKSVYYDYSIFLVTEIKLSDNTIYLVKIEDKTSWKTIKVCEGEDMQEIESCFKILQP